MDEKQRNSLTAKIGDTISLALPAIFGSVFIFMQETVNLLFISRLADPRMIAAVGLGNGFVNMFGLAVLVGMNGALNTLVSQAAGAARYSHCLQHVKASRAVLLLCFLPITALMVFSEPLMVAMGQSPIVAHYSGTYTLYYMPALLVAGFADSQRKLLNCLKKNRVTSLVQAVGTVSHVAWSYVLVIYLKLGIRGTAIACFITNTLMFLALLAYTYRLPQFANLAGEQSQNREKLLGDNQNSDTNFSETPDLKTLVTDYLKLGAPCALMICLEWWAYHIMQFMSGYFGIPFQTAQTVLVSILSLGLLVAIGLQQASSALIGQEIGKGNVHGAKQYHKAANCVAAGFFLVVIGLVLLFGNELIDLFLRDKLDNKADSSSSTDLTKQARSICRNLLFYCLMSKLGDYWQIQLQGTVRALGIQKKASNQNLLAYWVINIPLSLLISFWPLHFGYNGLWIAISVAQYYLAIRVTMMIRSVDWEERVVEAQMRLAAIGKK